VVRGQVDAIWRMYFRVAARESPHLGEGGAQIDGEPVDHFGAPALSFLSI